MHILAKIKGPDKTKAPKIAGHLTQNFEFCVNQVPALIKWNQVCLVFWPVFDHIGFVSYVTECNTVISSYDINVNVAHEG